MTETQELFRDVYDSILGENPNLEKTFQTVSNACTLLYGKDWILFMAYFTRLYHYSVNYDDILKFIKIRPDCDIEQLQIFDKFFGGLVNGSKHRHWQDVTIEDVMRCGTFGVVDIGYWGAEQPVVEVFTLEQLGLAWKENFEHIIFSDELLKLAEDISVNQDKYWGLNTFCSNVRYIASQENN